MDAAVLHEHLTIDSESDESVYQQIAGQIEALISGSELASGDRLPAIRTLATRLGLHRDTIALAYERLATEGWAEARVGAGTFVRPSGRRAGSVVASSYPPSGGSERASEVELALAPQVEQLITLDNTRPRYATGDDVVAFHRLIPDPRFYPVEEFRECIDAAIREEGPELFSYASPEGDPRLRRAMAERFRAEGIDRSADELVLCHGASQGISLALRLFAEPGDQIAVEVPTYANVLSAFAGLGLSPAVVSMDDEGADPEALDRVLAKPEVKAFYTIPSFHNPLGTSMSIERRHQVLEIAKRHGVPVIEDAFELDLRFQGDELPPLAALDESDLVVLLFSFSKSLFPGVRVGSLSAHGRALEGLVALKHATDLSDALLLQAGLARFVESGAYDRHLVRMRRLLRSRHAIMNEMLELEMPKGTTWTRPDGGYQLWVELPFEVDTRDLLADAARGGVLFSPGASFMPDGRPSRGMRLTVACVDEDEIRRGVAALGEVIRSRQAVNGRAGQRAGMHL
ncbi:MAG TPA: PLP-dependent aminotransferase family protein [Myxococcales bacterium]|nr:PLP-dependent aminotransferase family protein [Myxococcales bacterium]HIK85595.1 PLP-dependent aminotransferase family protein [Myxococcales bacterium]